MAEKRVLDAKAEASRPPCPLCHFCRIALEVRGVDRGGYCLWFDAPIREHEIDDRAAPLRRACFQDGEHFLWRMKDTDPIALVAWRKSLLDQEAQRRHRAWDARHLPLGAGDLPRRRGVELRSRLTTRQGRERGDWMTGDAGIGTHLRSYGGSGK